MTDSRSPSRTEGSVLVVLDPQFGERLRQSWPGRPVWIVMSPVNETALRSLWTSHPDTNHLTGITGFQFEPDAAPEDNFLGNLDTIDLHHGSCTEIEVIGARLTHDVREGLRDLGFEEFLERAGGFVARRSEEAAGTEPD